MARRRTQQRKNVTVGGQKSVPCQPKKPSGTHEYCVTSARLSPRSSLAPGFASRTHPAAVKREPGCGTRSRIQIERQP